ncbi:FAD-dependent monooxygenase [Microbacterium sp. gxy059]|uniref:FAD-dependent monooxygenase n=1 Tax=Microbacterium sp. gxy059 TaxID=2957199 RepID=UPI003D95204F
MSTPNDPTTSSRAETIIVGGSLGGLATALSLSNIGRSSTVLERTAGRTQRGVAIRAAGRALRRLMPADAYDIVERTLGERALQQGTYPQAWWDVYSALRTAADADPRIEIVEDARVVGVAQDADEARVTLEDGSVRAAEIVLGVDGCRSIVRRHVDETHPVADYAGYVVWLGQSELPAGLAGRIGGPDFDMRGGEMLATYPLMEADGGVRRYGWGWFDPGHNRLLREIGAIRGTEALHTPRASAIPDEVYDAMIRRAAQWAEPSRSGVIEAFRDREVIATPITEYVPQQVASGRVAVLGDAAHAQTPMTGAGFEEAAEDALVLGRVLAHADSPVEALQAYEALRLMEMQDGVEAGQSFSRGVGRA